MPLSLLVKPDTAPTTVTRSSGESRAPGPGRSIRLAALRVPLAVKLVGANLIVVAILLAARLMSGEPITRFVAALACGVIALHLLLVLLALRPIRDLEVLASRVWKGDFGARVERSSVADEQVLRVGSMFNILLDGLAADRTRMRTLAAEVIAVGDRERAGLARELHDSTAQRVAALLLQLSTAARDANDPLLAARLRAARDSTEEILEELRHLSHSVHPAVLDDLGLEAALRKLARDSSHGNGIVIDVNTERALRRFSRSVDAVLYRVAQEAVRNAIWHASPGYVRMNLYTDGTSAVLEIHDDGRGFELAEVSHRPGVGLLSMRERLALVDGWLDIKTARGNGTTVSATVPLGTEPHALH